jgi:Uma2 family endonuclease
VRTTRTQRRQPDLMVVRAEHRDRITYEGMAGAPDLVVEVLSASTRAVDFGDKRNEYAGL